MAMSCHGAARPKIFKSAKTGLVSEWETRPPHIETSALYVYMYTRMGNVHSGLPSKATQEVKKQNDVWFIHAMRRLSKTNPWPKKGRQGFRLYLQNL